MWCTMKPQKFTLRAMGLMENCELLLTDLWHHESIPQHLATQEKIDSPI